MKGTWRFLPCKKKRQSAFTLIELLVVMGIMSLIMGVVVSNHSRFGGKVLLRTLAYDTALSLRQAQTYGVSVRQSGNAAADETNFAPGYGMYFDSSTPTSFTLYADSNNNGLYTSGSDTIVEAFSLTRGYKISQLCYTNAVGAETCSTTGSPVQLNILFVRPEPDANIRVGTDTSTIYQRATIKIISPRGDLQHVVVEVSGQISVTTP